MCVCARVHTHTRRYLYIACSIECRRREDRRIQKREENMCARVCLILYVSLFLCHSFPSRLPSIMFAFHSSFSLSPPASRYLFIAFLFIPRSFWFFCLSCVVFVFRKLSMFQSQQHHLRPDLHLFCQMKTPQYHQV